MIEQKNGQTQRNISLDDVDWSGLRAASVAIGIRKAARQAARDLPPDEQERFVQRAMKRCSREKWLAKAEQDKADAIVMSSTALSANVRKGADVLSETFADATRETRISLARTALRVARRAERDNELRVKTVKDLRDLTAAAAQTGDWDKLGGEGKITLNVLNVQGTMHVEQ
jgi:hypothetical protein